MPQRTSPNPIHSISVAVDAKGARGIPKPELGDKSSFHFLAYEYVEYFVKPSRDVPEEVIRILVKDALPYWKGRDARTITSREIIERLDAIVGRGAPVMANRTAAILDQMFRFGVHRSIVSSSPVKLLFAPGGKERPEGSSAQRGRIAPLFARPAGGMHGPGPTSYADGPAAHARSSRLSRGSAVVRIRL